MNNQGYEKVMVQDVTEKSVEYSFTYDNGSPVSNTGTLTSVVDKGITYAPTGDTYSESRRTTTSPNKPFHSIDSYFVTTTTYTRTVPYYSSSTNQNASLGKPGGELRGTNIIASWIAKLLEKAVKK